MRVGQTQLTEAAGEPEPVDEPKHERGRGAAARVTLGLLAYVEREEDEAERNASLGGRRCDAHPAKRRRRERDRVRERERRFGQEHGSGAPQEQDEQDEEQEVIGTRRDVNEAESHVARGYADRRLRAGKLPGGRRGGEQARRRPAV